MLEKKYIAKLFGECLKLYRLENDLSIKKIEKMMGRTSIQIIEMENGKMDPDLIDPLTENLEMLIRNFIIGSLTQTMAPFKDELKK